MWELRYLNSCLGQLVSCKSLESPEIQQGYWFLWNLRYSSWKQLCLGVQQPELNLPFEKEFCGYFAKEIPNWRDFGGIFFSFFSTLLSLCGWKNYVIQQQVHCGTFQKDIFSSFFRKFSEHHSRKKSNH